MSFVGALLAPDRADLVTSPGTVFALGSPGIFATAAHVVAMALERSRDLEVAGPGVSLPVRAVATNAEADLALLVTDADPRVEPFRSLGRASSGDVVGVVAFAQMAYADAVTRVRAVLGEEDAPRITNGGPAWPAAETIVLEDALARGFCGAPVLDAEGALVGVITRELAGTTGEPRAVATSVEALVRWDPEWVNDMKELV